VITDSEIKNILTRKGKVQLFKKTHKRYKSINQKMMIQKIQRNDYILLKQGLLQKEQTS